MADKYTVAPDGKKWKIVLMNDRRTTVKGGLGATEAIDLCRDMNRKARNQNR